jgi:hypothetical protein
MSKYLRELDPTPLTLQDGHGHGQREGAPAMQESPGMQSPHEPSSYKDPAPLWFDEVGRKLDAWWATVPEWRRRQPFKHFNLLAVMPHADNAARAHILTSRGWIKTRVRYQGTTETIWMQADYALVVMATFPHDALTGWSYKPRRRRKAGPVPAA